MLNSLQDTFAFFGSGDAGDDSFLMPSKIMTANAKKSLLRETRLQVDLLRKARRRQPTPSFRSTFLDQDNQLHSTASIP